MLSPLAAVLDPNGDDCIVCEDRLRCMELLPCGHFILCARCCAAVCASANPCCPICRTVIRSTVAIAQVCSDQIDSTATAAPAASSSDVMQQHHQQATHRCVCVLSLDRQQQVGHFPLLVCLMDATSRSTIADMVEKIHMLGAAIRTHILWGFVQRLVRSELYFLLLHVVEYEHHRHYPSSKLRRKYALCVALDMLNSMGKFLQFRALLLPKRCSRQR